MEDGGDICDICCERFDDGDHHPVLVCDEGHTMCMKCFNILLNSPNPICPSCRTRLKNPPTRNRALLRVIDAARAHSGAPVRPEGSSGKKRVLHILDTNSLKIESSKGPIGTGSTGDVYCGTLNGATVAIKRARTVDKKYHKLIKHEVLVMQEVRHPCIVSVYGYTEIDGFPSIVMEYGDGGSLEGLLSSHSLTSEQVVPLALNIVQGLEFLHSRNIIHRDLKPGNVLLCRSKAKLTDFGGSKVLRESAASSSMGIGRGTVRYSAIEQMEDDQEHGTFTDVYALSIMLYEIFSCGGRAFDSMSDMNIMRHKALGKAPVFSDGSQAVPEPYVRLAKAVWEARDPHQRPPLSAFIKLLRAMEHHGGSVDSWSLGGRARMDFGMSRLSIHESARKDKIEAEKKDEIEAEKKREQEEINRLNEKVRKLEKEKKEKEIAHKNELDRLKAMREREAEERESKEMVISGHRYTRHTFPGDVYTAASYVICDSCGDKPLREFYHCHTCGTKDYCMSCWRSGRLSPCHESRSPRVIRILHRDPFGEFGSPFGGFLGNPFGGGMGWL
eukprot:TRINITY_DN1319_c0_g1_i1.p1 TRINITY_DN1319_c0_g1~~TRINITY_DN1319_c0_g1_i1.p1  ORF type:complete len:557 (+),score=107.66 TRINITY_DN1319_c0_g1_i1:84-1754(+)